MNKWYFDELYEALIVNGQSEMFTQVLRWFDQNIIDGIVNGVGSTTKKFAVFFGKFDKYVIDGFVNFIAYFAGFCGLVLRKNTNRASANVHCIRSTRRNGDIFIFKGM